MIDVDALVAFTTARIDEAGADAQSASPGPWHTNVEQDQVWAVDDVLVADGFALSNNQLRATVRHIARHDPGSVLAEVEVDRRILRLHTGEHDCVETRTGIYPPDWPAYAPWGKAGEPFTHASVEHVDEGQACETVLLLAARFASHAAYDTAWRPA